MQRDCCRPVAIERVAGPVFRCARLQGRATVYLTMVSRSAARVIAV